MFCLSLILEYETSKIKVFDSFEKKTLSCLINFLNSPYFPTK